MAWEHFRLLLEGLEEAAGEGESGWLCLDCWPHDLVLDKGQKMDGIPCFHNSHLKVSHTVSQTVRSMGVYGDGLTLGAGFKWPSGGSLHFIHEFLRLSVWRRAQQKSPGFLVLVDVLIWISGEANVTR